MPILTRDLLLKIKFQHSFQQNVVELFSDQSRRAQPAHQRRDALRYKRTLADDRRGGHGSRMMSPQCPNLLWLDETRSIMVVLSDTSVSSVQKAALAVP